MSLGYVMLVIEMITHIGIHIPSAVDCICTVIVNQYHQCQTLIQRHHEVIHVDLNIQ